MTTETICHEGNNYPNTALYRRAIRLHNRSYRLSAMLRKVEDRELSERLWDEIHEAWTRNHVRFLVSIEAAMEEEDNG